VRKTEITKEDLYKSSFRFEDENGVYLGNFLRQHPQLPGGPHFTFKMYPAKGSGTFDLTKANCPLSVPVSIEVIPNGLKMLNGAIMERRDGGFAFIRGE